jgi:hypothetical protein
MSCSSYGKLPKGQFSGLKNTWSCKSDLTMNSWDPFPELQNPKNCYGTNTENYENCSLYKTEKNRVGGDYKPLQQSAITSGTLLREAYSPLCCGPTPYNNLKQTWEKQKPYTL